MVCRLRVAIFSQLFLRANNAMTEPVHIAKVFENFRNNRVAVGVVTGEISPRLSVQPTGIMDFYAVGKPKKTDGLRTFIIPVHDGVHQQFSQRPLRIIGGGNFP